jgi:deoxyhypusine synthase
MLCDKTCTVMFTVSGAMTIAKKQLLVADLLDTGRVKYVAATGALMAHGLIEGAGCQHFKYDPRFSDEELANEGLNRVTDTIEPEGNFDHIEEIVSAVLDDLSGKSLEPHILSSSVFHMRLGKYLKEHYPDQRAILKSAYEQMIPIVTPAVVDSELGNDIFVHNARRKQQGLGRLVFDQELDTQVLFDLATNAERLGIFTIGGGVPRNNTQNVAPLIEIYNGRLDTKLSPGIFHYACRIDPSEMFWGNLSGCTYSEGASWRKFDFEGPKAEIQADATIIWAFIQKFALERFALAA